MKRIVLLLVVAAFVAGCKETPENKFVYVENGQFILDGEPYYYVGANFWYGAILGSPSVEGGRERLGRELDFLKSVGVTNLRVLVGSDGEPGVFTKVEPTLQLAPGVYDDDMLAGLDWLLAEMGEREMKAVLFFNNTFEWSGGYGQYLDWAGYGTTPIPSVDGWGAYFDFIRQFIPSEEAKAIFAGYVNDIVTRTNRYTGIEYINDPAIFSWQIGNEPQPCSTENGPMFAQWIGDVARQIRSLDPNHLISTGSEGRHGCNQDMALCEQIHAFPEIGYVNCHIWPYNWGWVAPETMDADIDAAIANTGAYIEDHLALAERLGKPLVVEEFGFPRDGMRFAKGSPVTLRDAYYKYIFGLVEQSARDGGLLAGCNFWGWGGFAEPATGRVLWLPGDDYTGDPAQEEQGLNSVFAADDSTVELIRAANESLRR